MASADEEAYPYTRAIVDGEEVHVGELSVQHVADPQREWPMSSTPYVFLSHTGRDKTKELIARPTYWFLKHVLDVTVFFDDAEARPGNEKIRAMTEPAYRCTHALIIFSPSYRTREFCVRELNTFMSRWRRQDGIRILPALWMMNDLRGYHPGVKTIIWIPNSQTWSTVDYLVDSLWPCLVDSFGRGASDDLEGCILQYVEAQRGQMRDIPSCFEAYCKSRRKPQNVCPSNPQDPTPPDHVQRVRQDGIPLPSGPPDTIIPDCPRLVGREELLQQLREALRSGGTMASLAGIAGVGKTHCAKYFAREWWEHDVSNRFVFWLTATSESTIRRHYQEVLKRLGMSPRDQDLSISTGALSSLVWNRLDRISRDLEWLLVFDDVSGDLEDPKEFAKVFLPTNEGSWGRGRILLTTRNQAYKGKLQIGHITQIRANALDEDSALAMFLAAIGESPGSDDDVAMDLVSVQLAGLPLAIETASSDIASRGISVREYIRETNLSSVYDKVDTVLRSSLVRARNEYGLGELLDIAAFVNPDCIQREILGADPDSVGKLCNLCILQRLTEGVYSFHKLYQQVARRGRPVSSALSSVERVLSSFDQQESSSWPLAVDSVSHVEALLSVSSKLDDIDKIKLAGLFIKSGDVLHHILCDFRSALSKYKKAVELHHEVHGEDIRSRDIGLAHYQIAMVLQEVGEYGGAIESFKTALSCARTDEDRALTASVIFRLGTVYQKLSKYVDARRCFSESLELNLQLQSKNESNTVAEALHYMGKATWNLGDYGGAEKYFIDSLAIKRRTLPEESHSIAWTMHEMGCLDYAIGKYGSALKKFDEVVQIEKALVGGRPHIYIAFVESWKGRTLLAMGRYSQALQCFGAAENIETELHGRGESRISTAIRLSCVSNALHRLGRFDEAIIRCNESLNILYNCFPDKRETRNDKIAISLCTMSSILINQGDLDRAESMLRQSQDMFEECFPSGKHSQIAQLLFEFARLKLKRRQFNAARTDLVKARTMLLDVLKDNAARTTLYRDIDATLSDVRDRQRTCNVIAIAGGVAFVSVCAYRWRR